MTQDRSEYLDALMAALSGNVKKRSGAGSLPESDYRALYAIIQRTKELSTESLKLPLPRRFSLEPTQDYYQTFLGSMLTVIDILVQEDMALADIARGLIEETSYGAWFADKGINRRSLEQMLQMRRFQLRKAPIFTYRKSLCQKLDDMDIGSKVPMALLRPPYNDTYIEFGPAELRGQLGYQVFAAERWNILEGAYVSFHGDADRSILSEKGKQVLSIDEDSPLKCMEIAFTGSPLDADEDKQSVLNDTGAYISLYWTDDDQTIEETLKRHFSLIAERDNVSGEMRRSLEENMRRLAKALLYLITGNRYRSEETPERDLSKRLEALKNPAKARKVRSQLMRAYDRVVIGPDAPYVPLDERLQGIKHRTGVQPHFRRAHWSTRWSGKGKTIPRPVQIGITLVNAEGLSDEDVMLLQKDYDVR